MNIDKVSQCVVNVAENEILPRFKNLTSHDIIEKKPGDLVSIADTEAEIALSRDLQDLFPQAVIAGEESISHNDGLLQAVISADIAFLIDPVDGTNNFIKGDDRFALMLTLLKKSDVVASWIYLPAYDKLAVAEKGSGAYLNGDKIIISQKEIIIEEMIGAAHLNRFPENMKVLARENIKTFKHNKPAFCAGYDYIALLEEIKNFSVYYRTLPWDHLPGGLIFSEAGGYVRTLLNEQKYTIYDQTNGLLSAANIDQWHKIKDAIFSGDLID